MTVLDHGLAPTAAVMEQAFSDYFVKIPFSAAALLAMARQDSVDLLASRVWLRDGQPVAVLLQATRGWRGRLAGMGVISAARHQGVGAHAVAAWIADARAHGLHSLGLEVIGANAPALRLYERFGFTRVRRLAGWTAAAGQATTSAGDPRSIDPRVMARHITERDPDGTLPWQIAGESVAQLGPPWTAWHLDGAEVVISDLDSATVSLRGLTWAENAGSAAATRLLRSLMAAHPGHSWRAPALFPESWGPVFEQAGWQPSPIDQWQMTLPLAN